MRLLQNLPETPIFDIIAKSKIIGLDGLWVQYTLFGTKFLEDKLILASHEKLHVITAKFTIHYPQTLYSFNMQ